MRNYGAIACLCLGECSKNIMNWCGDEVDDGDKGLVVAISSCPAFGRLEDAVERFTSSLVLLWPEFQRAMMAFRCLPIVANAL